MEEGSNSSRLMTYRMCGEAEGRIRAGDLILVDGDALVLTGDLVVFKRANCFAVARFSEALACDYICGKIVEVTMRP